MRVRAISIDHGAGREKSSTAKTTVYLYRPSYLKSPFLNRS